MTTKYDELVGCFAGFFVFSLKFIIRTILIYCSWNYVIFEVCDVDEITFWQAMLLTLTFFLRLKGKSDE